MSDENLESPPTESANRIVRQIQVNFALAGILTGLGLWLVTADLLHSSDPLFRSSLSLNLMTLYMSALSAASLVLAAIPKRIVVTAACLLLLRLALGFPFNLWLPNPAAANLVSAGLVATGAWYLFACFRNALSIGSRPWFKPTHSMALIASGVVLFLCSLPIFVFGYLAGFRNLIGDYVRLSLDSVSLVERVFEKNGQKVHLIGMMHIGDGSYYKELEERMNAPLEVEGQRRLVLTEGVADSSRLLPETFTNGKTYGKFAKMLGVSTQQKFDAPPSSGQIPIHSHSHADFVNADIDIAELEPGHRNTLVTILEWLGTVDPANPFLQAPDGVTPEDIEGLFLHGLLGQRNDALMARFADQATAYPEIFIPWGAAHLGDIENRLRLLGYSSVGETIRPILTFGRK